jgi:predicted NUDIX family NTP pyrophosphohydrolase
MQWEKRKGKVKKFSLPPHFNYFQLRERKKKVRKISSKGFLPIGRGGLRWG